MKNIWTKASLPLSLSFAAVLMFGLSPVVDVQSQNGETSQAGDAILEIGKEFDPPVKIALVKSRVGVIEPSKKVSADEDWFKGLAVSVCNSSEKPLTHISLKILFPRPRGQENELDFVESLNYGESPIPSADGQIPFNSAKPITPGECVELRLLDDDYDDVKTVLKDSKYPSKIKKLKLSVSMLGFSDGTLWIGGKRHKLDKNSPGKLIPLEKKMTSAPFVRSNSFLSA